VRIVRGHRKVVYAATHNRWPQRAELQRLEERFRNGLIRSLRLNWMLLWL
jgi:hypothetical protein